MNPSVRTKITLSALVMATAVLSGMEGARGVRAADLVDEPPTQTNGGSIVEDYSYPGAAQILATQNVKLISGDGHILLADCAMQPVNNVGVIKVWTTEPIGESGIGQICFKVLAATGRLDLEVPGVYEIRGDGQGPGNGHPLTAVVKTDTGSPLTVVCNPSGSTQVGIGADPNNDPTTLLQLRVPS
jgi:hypothetical protein